MQREVGQGLRYSGGNWVPLRSKCSTVPINREFDYSGVTVLLAISKARSRVAAH